MVRMKRYLKIAICVMTLVFLVGCGKSEGTESMSLFSGEKIVGKDIQKEDITDFYYTVSNINYDAFYQRYWFYIEDGKHIFFHETRERKNDYGPCTEDDTTLIGTIELTDDQWDEFYDFVIGGKVKAREESADSGSEGPWLYLYWTNDKSKIQQFSFESYEKQKRFEDYCKTLVQRPAEIMNTFEVTDPDLSEEYIKEDKLVTMVRYYEMSDGTWKTDKNSYKYRLEITGRMSNAAKESTFIYLSNVEEISFERAYMAAGLSSNMDDYFDPKDAVLVAMK